MEKWFDVTNHKVKNKYSKQLKAFIKSKVFGCDLILKYAHVKKKNSKKKNSPLFRAGMKCKFPGLKRMLNMFLLFVLYNARLLKLGRFKFFEKYVKEVISHKIIFEIIFERIKKVVAILFIIYKQFFSFCETFKIFKIWKK